MIGLLGQISAQAVLDQLGQTARETGWIGWGMLIVGIFGGVVAGKLSQMLLRKGGERVQGRGWKVRGTIIASFAGPTSLILLTMGLTFGLSGVRMADGVRVFAGQVLALMWIVAVGWLLFNLVDLVDVALHRFAARTHTTFDDLILPLVRKTLRIFLVVVLILFTAENVFGANIGAWLAGLGIAGLAVSLAAQESIKNIFGSLTIFLDRPFTLGQLVNLNGHTGNVEAIGFRSTRLRTLKGHLVSIPNSKVVDNDVENLGLRPYIRREMNITITYDTPLEKVERAVEVVREILAEEEIAAAFNVDMFPPRVFFDELNSDSLNIKVFYWHFPPDFWMFLEHSQRVNLRLMKRFEEAGIEFAFPTQTVFLAGDPNRELAMKITGAEIPSGSDTESA